MEKITETILKFLHLDGLVQNLTGYVEARISLMKVEVKEDMARAMARGMVFVALFFMAFLFLVFFSIGLAQFLNTFFSFPYAGYWIVSGIYGATFLIVLVFRKNINHNFEKYFAEIMKGNQK